ncbi:MAG: hypothetical protein ACFFD2_05370 [Promethearchaeota archaeon]
MRKVNRIEDRLNSLYALNNQDRIIEELESIVSELPEWESIYDKQNISKSIL